MAFGYKTGQMARLAGQPFGKCVIDLGLVPSLWGFPDAKLSPSSLSKRGLQWPFSSMEDTLWFCPGDLALPCPQATVSWPEFLAPWLETALQHTSPNHGFVIKNTLKDQEMIKRSSILQGKLTFPVRPQF